MSSAYGKIAKSFFDSWYLFVAYNHIFLTHITHMRNVRNGGYAYGLTWIYTICHLDMFG